MWYPGGEGGTSTARLLLGLANPSGHTVMTWPAAATDTIYTYNQTAPLYPGDTTGVHNERLGVFANTPSATFNFSEGIYVGYRFFDQAAITPAYPWGRGLSYTTFGFSNLQATPTSNGGLDVAFDVTNTGSTAGAEVPQVYVGPAPGAPAGVQQAARALAGFDRAVLDPGQTAHELIHLGPGADANGYGNRRAFDYWSSPNQQWAALAGCRVLWVGDADSTTNLPLSTTSCIQPSTTVPEAPWVALFVLPVTGLAAAAVMVTSRRRRRVA
jgi:beta-glucosidase